MKVTLNVRFVCSHFTNFLKYIFLFWGQSVLFTTFQLTGTVRATFQLTYISAYWDSPKLCFRGPRARPRGASRARPIGAHRSPPDFVLISDIQIQYCLFIFRVSRTATDHVRVRIVLRMCGESRLIIHTFY